MKYQKAALAAMTSVAAAVSLWLAPQAQAAQGGDDRSGDPHTWIKVSAGELRPGSVVGFDKACTNIFGYGYPNYRPCDQMIPLLVNQRFSNMKAAGYWAEWYYKSGRTRAGIW